MFSRKLILCSLLLMIILLPASATLDESSECKEGCGAAAEPMNRLSLLQIPVRTISGIKFHDLNGDASYTGNDYGIPGWKIFLTPSEGAPVMETMTNDSGYYEFSGIDPTRSYRVEEAIHPGWVNTTPLSETISFTCSDFPNLPPSGTVNIQHNQGGFYWLITAKNIPSGYDIVNSPPTYAGWCVDLDHQIGNGDHGVRLFISSYDDLTPLYGRYPHVQNVAWDKINYLLNHRQGLPMCVVERTIWNFTNNLAITTQNIGGCPLTNDQVNAALAFRNEVNANGHGYRPACGDVLGVLIDVSTPSSTPQLNIMEVPVRCCDQRVDFGNQRVSGNISGLKVRAEDNEPLEGWEITLKYENGTIYRTTTTNVNGRFSFDFVPLGNYTVHELIKDGWLIVSPAEGYYQVSLNQETFNVTDLIFSNDPAGSISGYKRDSGNGQGLASWEINLFNTTGLVASTLTNETGWFIFQNLAWGDYILNETLQTGWIPVDPPSGSYPVTINYSSLVIENRNFSNQKQRGMISGIKFEDLNKNGVQDVNDGNLSGWTINLYNQSSGILLNSTSTDGNGKFSFSGLDWGVYLLRETQKAGWNQTAPAGGSFIIEINGTSLTIDGLKFGNNKICDKCSCPSRAYFTYSPTTVKDGKPVVFTDGSKGNIIQWNWSFGDGTFDEHKNPVHIFHNPPKPTKTTKYKSYKVTEYVWCACSSTPVVTSYSKTINVYY